LDELIASLRESPGVGIEDQPSSWKLHIASPPNISVELVVPHSVLEWFVTVRDATTDAEVWSDWMDYQGYVRKAEENLEELRRDMHSDIQWFVTTLGRATDFRIVPQRVLGLLSSNRAEWYINGQWHRVQLTPRVGDG
jgi:hypothetical protein